VSPHRIEHFFLPDPDAIPRAADLELAIAVQPTIAEWTGDQRNAEEDFGDSRPPRVPVFRVGPRSAFRPSSRAT
jgi:predicted amidohydrolase YtcJ